MTSAAWTATPSPTLTPTPTSTSTSTPTATSTITPLPLPEGWHSYNTSSFDIALPKQWTFVDIDKEGAESLLNSLKDMNTEWAQTTTKVLSAEALQKAIKLWARDTQPAGIGYATAIVAHYSLPFPAKISDLCSQMASAYKQMSAEVIDTQCDLKINELDANRFTTRIPLGSLSGKQYQYVYLQERQMWVLTLAVDETEWANYESVFETIAESFRVSK